ncbi:MULTISPECIES: aminotransferase class IV [unclassified Corynebacterium]|uniref:aminotransferase class IV n=1 Tax=Corynebacterium TaxID=1716 RepID=UPI0025509674|nr:MULTISPECIES: aminotransferase class IV [unclassified Corynebacterium]MDK8477077.1 aminotransferase class IV [Corynebacterium sp. MSK310]MDK8492520.1 aminotransferase class IV [Corynebacterium sp. MSK175]MDK8673577.1 aminotransferase class IV [Corynebacterium sp. MSK189]MDK8703013.1 aminotransferase class IV [Corynebacterium sp. MSK107]MDK8705424.1 aminotransferase class IV [Corynebacterium sp. MSK090]
MSSYIWRDGAFIPCTPPADPCTVADSWRHSAGRTHGLHLHLERFESAAGTLPAGFVPAMLELLSGGELFPRIALIAGELYLDIRPAPAPRAHTRLTYVKAPDPRVQPLVKGPDLPALAAYRSQYQESGTDDTAIVDAHGAIAETTTGALIAWDGDTFLLPTGVRLPSVTLRQVLDRCKDLRISTAQRPLTPALAAEYPLWFINSLHGISPVSSIHTPHGSITPPPHPAAASWQNWWWRGFSPAGAGEHCT